MEPCTRGPGADRFLLDLGWFWEAKVGATPPATYKKHHTRHPQETHPLLHLVRKSTGFSPDTQTDSGQISSQASHPAAFLWNEGSGEEVPKI